MHASNTMANRVSASGRGPRHATIMTTVMARNSAVNSMFAPDAGNRRYTTLGTRTAPPWSGLNAHNHLPHQDLRHAVNTEIFVVGRAVRSHDGADNENFRV